MTLLGTTETSMHWSLMLLTCQPYILLQAGSRSFIQLLLTCPRQRSWCFQLYMPFSTVYKTMFTKCWQIFLTLHHINWEMAWSRLTRNSVTIIIVQMSLCTILGLVVCFMPSPTLFFTDNWPLFSLLDPQITYEGLRRDCASDPTLLTDLNNAQHQLKTFYNKNYVNWTHQTPIQSSQSSSSFSSTSGSLPHSPEKVNITSCYKKEDWVVINKLDEFYKLPQEDSDSWNGGLGDNHNFLISIASCMTFSQFQVHLLLAYRTSLFYFRTPVTWSPSLYIYILHPILLSLSVDIPLVPWHWEYVFPFPYAISTYSYVSSRSASR